MLHRMSYGGISTFCVLAHGRLVHFVPQSAAFVLLFSPNPASLAHLHIVRTRSVLLADPSTNELISKRKIATRSENRLPHRDIGPLLSLFVMYTTIHVPHRMHPSFASLMLVGYKSRPTRLYIPLRIIPLVPSAQSSPSISLVHAFPGLITPQFLGFYV